MNTLTKANKCSGKSGDDVKIGSSVTPFESVGKSPAVDKTASDLYNANLKVEKIRRLVEWDIPMRTLHATFLECWISCSME